MTPLVLLVVQARVAEPPPLRSLVLSAPLPREQRVPLYEVVQDRIKLKDGREIRRFVTTMSDGRRSILYVEAGLLPDPYYQARRAAYGELAKAWHPGQPVDLGAPENRKLDGWLSSQMSPEERARTPRFFLNTSKTLTLSGGGRTVSYEMDVSPEFPDEAYEPMQPDARSNAKTPVKSDPTIRLERPTSERHFYHRLAPSYLDELALTREAAKWLEDRWRRMAADFQKEFAEFEALMEAERRGRERIAPIAEGTDFGDLPPESQQALRTEFEINWAQMGFPNAQSAINFLQNSKAGPTREALHVITPGLQSDGTQFKWIRVINLP